MSANQALKNLAELLDLPIDKVSDTMKVSGRHVSMDAPFANGEESSLLDVLVNHDSPKADIGLMNESLSKKLIVHFLL